MATCFVVIGIVGGIAVRQALIRSPKHDLPADAVPQARAAVKHFESTKQVPAADVRQMVEALSRAQPIKGQHDEIDLNADARAAFFAMVAEWLSYRANLDHDGYVAWMRSRNYSLALEDVGGESRRGLSREDREMAWRYYTGEDLPNDLAPAEFFRVCFVGCLNAKGSFLRPASVSEDALVSFRAIQSVRSNPSPLPIDEFPEEETWVGFASSGDREHWRPPISYAELLSRDRVAVTAVLLMAVRGQGGQWVPTTLAAYYDMGSNEWHILTVVYSNSFYRGIAIER